MTQMDWLDKRVAIVPCAALGDVTLYLHLAWLFHRAGARVRFVSGTLYPARDYFDWLQVETAQAVDLPALAGENDLVICYVNALPQDASHLPEILAQTNIALVTAKKLPSHLGVDGREVRVGERVFAGASRALCQRSRAGMSMVQWVDEYAASVFGLRGEGSVPLRRLTSCPDASRRVAIFPTTPHDKKNYAQAGFLWLARRLRARGWLVEFVGMPRERETLGQAYSGFPVHAFADVRGLMDFLATCAVVVSNDSGGGHLGSLMGLRSFTITRKSANFVWRPGFNAHNEVLAPLASFKLLGRYVWCPFIPVWRIPRRLGRAH